MHPNYEHWASTKRVMRYLKVMVDFGLIYEKGKKNHKIFCCSESDSINDMEDKKSTSGLMDITWPICQSYFHVSRLCSLK